MQSIFKLSQVLILLSLYLQASSGVGWTQTSSHEKVPVSGKFKIKLSETTEVVESLDWIPLTTSMTEGLSLDSLDEGYRISWPQKERFTCYRLPFRSAQIVSAVPLTKFNQIRFQYLIPRDLSPSIMALALNVSGIQRHSPQPVIFSPAGNAIHKTTLDSTREPLRPKDNFYRFRRLLDLVEDDGWRYVDENTRVIFQRRFNERLSNVGAIDLVFKAGVELEAVNFMYGSEYNPGSKKMIQSGHLTKKLISSGNQVIWRFFVPDRMKKLNNAGDPAYLKEIIFFLKGGGLAKLRPLEKVVFLSFYNEFMKTFQTPQGTDSDVKIVLLPLEPERHSVNTRWNTMVASLDRIRKETGWDAVLSDLMLLVCPEAGKDASEIQIRNIQSRSVYHETQPLWATQGERLLKRWGGPFLAPIQNPYAIEWPHLLAYVPFTDKDTPGIYQSGPAKLSGFSSLSHGNAFYQGLFVSPDALELKVLFQSPRDRLVVQPPMATNDFETFQLDLEGKLKSLWMVRHNSDDGAAQEKLLDNEDTPSSYQLSIAPSEKLDTASRKWIRGRVRVERESAHLNDQQAHTDPVRQLNLWGITFASKNKSLRYYYRPDGLGLQGHSGELNLSWPIRQKLIGGAKLFLNIARGADQIDSITLTGLEKGKVLFTISGYPNQALSLGPKPEQYDVLEISLQFKDSHPFPLTLREMVIFLPENTSIIKTRKLPTIVDLSTPAGTKSLPRKLPPQSVELKKNKFQWVASPPRMLAHTHGIRLNFKSIFGSTGTSACGIEVRLITSQRDTRKTLCVPFGADKIWVPLHYFIPAEQQHIQERLLKIQINVTGEPAQKMNGPTDPPFNWFLEETRLASFVELARSFPVISLDQGWVYLPEKPSLTNAYPIDEEKEWLVGSIHAKQDMLKTLAVSMTHPFLNFSGMNLLEEQVRASEDNYDNLCGRPRSWYPSCYITTTLFEWPGGWLVLLLAGGAIGLVWRKRWKPGFQAILQIPDLTWIKSDSWLHILIPPVALGAILGSGIFSPEQSLSLTAELIWIILFSVAFWHGLNLATRIDTHQKFPSRKNITREPWFLKGARGLTPLFIIGSFFVFWSNPGTEFELFLMILATTYFFLPRLEKQVCQWPVHKRKMAFWGAASAVTYGKGLAIHLSAQTFNEYSLAALFAAFATFHGLWWLEKMLRARSPEMASRVYRSGFSVCLSMSAIMVALVAFAMGIGLEPIAQQIALIGYYLLALSVISGVFQQTRPPSGASSNTR